MIYSADNGKPTMSHPHARLLCVPACETGGLWKKKQLNEH